jgi:epsilon-lactone hydrolase
VRIEGDVVEAPFAERTQTLNDQQTRLSPATTARPAAPRSLSERARASLTRDFSALNARPFPDPDDVAGWLRHVKAGDAMMAQRIPDRDLPVKTLETEISGVHTYVVRPNDVPYDDTTPVYLDFHGGALIHGGGELCRKMAEPMAVARGMIVWAVDYRMPPLHPYPAALDDGVAVYRALLEQRTPEHIFVGGGSAGGNLAAALMVRLGEEKLPTPAGLVLITPEIDLTESGDTFTTLLGVDNVLMASLMDVNLLYAAGQDLADPHLSPLFADLTGFPPTFLQSGTRDLLLSNTVRMHRKLRAAGVDAELHIWEAMPHGGFGGAPEDVEVVIEVRRFLDRHQHN